MDSIEDFEIGKNMATSIPTTEIHPVWEHILGGCITNGQSVSFKDDSYEGQIIVFTLLENGKVAYGTAWFNNCNCKYCDQMERFNADQVDQETLREFFEENVYVFDSWQELLTFLDFNDPRKLDGAMLESYEYIKTKL